MFLEADGEKMLLLPGDPLNPERPPGDDVDGVDDVPPPVETRFVLAHGRWRARAARA